MSAQLACFLEEKNSETFVSGFVGNLFEANCCAEASGPCKTLAYLTDGACRKTHRRLRCRHRPHHFHGPAAEGQMSHRRLQELAAE